MLMHNNIFGRADLGKDTDCCRYLGKVGSLEACTAAADARPDLSAKSVTWHANSKGSGGWSRTCYAIVDDTWKPVIVKPIEAEAHSARFTCKEVRAAPKAAPRPPESWPWISKVASSECLKVVHTLTGPTCDTGSQSCGAGKALTCGAQIDWYLRNEPTEYNSVHKAARFVATKYKPCGPCENIYAGATRAASDRKPRDGKPKVDTPKETENREKKHREKP